LSDAETAQIAVLVRAQRALPWDSEPFRVSVARAPRQDRIVAAGTTKIAMGDDLADAERLVDAINALLALVPGGELRVWDDFDMFGWDPDEGCTLEGDRTAEPIEVAASELVDPETIAPAPAKPARKRSGDDIASMVAALADADGDEAKELGARLDAAPAADVITAVFAKYKKYHPTPVKSALWAAQERLDDAAPVADAFLALWSNPTGKYFYGDVTLSPRFRAALARVPSVHAHLVADVARTEGTDDELVHRCAEAALDMLARDPSDRGLRAMLEIVRARRGRPLPWRVELQVFGTAHEKLAEHGDARCAPTLLYYVGATSKFKASHGRALIGLARVDPARALPHLVTLAASGGRLVHVAQALAFVPDPAATATLRDLAGHGDKEIHAIASRVLAERGEPVADRAAPPPEELVLDPDHDARHRALHAIAKRHDRSTFLSLLYAEAFDAVLRARDESPGLPFSWWEWSDVLPKKILGATAKDKLAWAKGDGKAILGEQVIWPSVEPVVRLGAAKHAESHPRVLLALPAEELAALEAEETAILNGLSA
jgi:hypothetical protein